MLTYKHYLTSSSLTNCLILKMLTFLYTFIQQKLMSKCTWKEHKTDNGRVYYHNSVTKQSTWDKPAELVEIEGKSNISIHIRFDNTHWFLSYIGYIKKLTY